MGGESSEVNVVAGGWPMVIVGSLAVGKRGSDSLPSEEEDRIWESPSASASRLGKFEEQSCNVRDLRAEFTGHAVLRVLFTVFKVTIVLARA